MTCTVSKSPSSPQVLCFFLHLTSFTGNMLQWKHHGFLPGRTTRYRSEGVSDGWTANKPGSRMQQFSFRTPWFLLALKRDKAFPLFILENALELNFTGVFKEFVPPFPPCSAGKYAVSADRCVAHYVHQANHWEPGFVMRGFSPASNMVGLRKQYH